MILINYTDSIILFHLLFLFLYDIYSVTFLFSLNNSKTYLSNLIVLLAFIYFIT